MDTTAQYIKMRVAAIPGMGVGAQPMGPIYFITRDVWVDQMGDWYYSDGDRRCQLERQDQLQEMVGFDLHEYGLPLKLAEILEEIGLTGYAYCKSMEQLWLAFVQHEKYNKVWDGETWLTSKLK